MNGHIVLLAACIESNPSNTSYITSGVATLGHTGARAPATRGCAPAMGGLRVY